MSGNVSDWCWDWFDKNYYKQFEGQSAKNPTGPEKGSYRVRRGGSTPVTRNFHIGFRLARTL